MHAWQGESELGKKVFNISYARCFLPLLYTGFQTSLFSAQEGGVSGGRGGG